MKRLLLIGSLSCLMLTMLSAQTWDGGGATNNWDEAANWDTDMVPATGATVVFSTDGITITGTMTNVPARITIAGSAEVTLDLDVEVSGDDHCIVLNSNTTLNVGTAGSNRVVDLSPNLTNKNGFAVFGSADGAVINIAGSTTVNITGGFRGFNIQDTDGASVINDGMVVVAGADNDGIQVQTGASFTNNGSITITTAGNDGIENYGTFTNSSGGDLDINGAGGQGINHRGGASFTNQGTIFIDGSATNDGIRSESAFTNTASGSITVDKVGDDGLEILNGSTFTNHGTIDATVEDAANTDNVGIAVGTSTEAATLVNTSHNTITVNGGVSTSGRGIYVYEMGSLDNTGTITFSGGNDGSRLYSRGTVNNQTGGVLNMTDGRINLNDGTLENDGLILSTRGTSAILMGTGVTATNNAFFSYTGNSNFAVGSNGTSVDNGIDLNDAAETSIDAGNLCTVTIANASYTYTDNADFTETSTAVGELTFPAGSIGGSLPITIETTIGSNTISLMVDNICLQALPVDLLSINAVPTKDEVLVRWQTASELNNDYMAVERSTDGASFRELGRVTGAGTTNQIQNYTWTDRQPVQGMNFYRLRQVDYDGSITYSAIVHAKMEAEEVGLRVYPMVLQRGASFTLESTAAGQVKVFNHLGQLAKTYQVSAGRQLLPTQDLAAGQYYLRSASGPLTNTQRLFIIH